MLFVLVLVFIIVTASIMAVAVRMDERNKINEVEKGDLSADDFEIIE